MHRAEDLGADTSLRHRVAHRAEAHRLVVADAAGRAERHGVGPAGRTCIRARSSSSISEGTRRVSACGRPLTRPAEVPFGFSRVAEPSPRPDDTQSPNAEATISGSSSLQTGRRASRAARSSRRLHLRGAARPPSLWRSLGKTAPVFRLRGRCADASSASPRAAANLRRAKRRRPRRRFRDGEAPWRVPALPRPRPRISPFDQQAA